MEMPRGVRRSFGTAWMKAFSSSGELPALSSTVRMSVAQPESFRACTSSRVQVVVPPDWEAMEAMVCRIFMMPFP